MFPGQGQHLVALFGRSHRWYSELSFLAATKPDILQKASVGIIEQKMCGALYNFSLTDRMLCAGFLEGRVDSCQVGGTGIPQAPS